MTSIRRRLLIFLLALFALSWLAVAGATFYETQHEIEEVFDAQLAQAARIVGVLPLDSLSRSDLPGSVVAKDHQGHKYERNISFQIWRDGKLLLRSESAPEHELSAASGISDVLIDDRPWRIFRLDDQGGERIVYVGENHDAREELTFYITRAVLTPMLGAIPLLAILTWIAVGRGLAPLGKLAREVTERNPERLTAIRSEDAPREIQPLTVALNRLLDRLREALDQERQFTNDAAHELRTPLASIKTQAQVLIRSRSPECVGDNLDKIVQGVDRASHLVDQLLTLARLEPERIVERFQAVNLNQVASSVIAELAPNAVAHSIELELQNHVPPGTRCAVSGHESGLTILLRNLVDNAIRYSPPGSRVEVSVIPDGDHCVLAVTDNGPGIPHGERQRVFDRFYRSAGQAVPGCGLGLAIVRRIAELHDTQVELSSGEDGKGLRVDLRLPWAPQHGAVRV